MKHGRSTCREDGGRERVPSPARVPAPSLIPTNHEWMSKLESIRKICSALEERSARIFFCAALFIRFNDLMNENIDREMRELGIR